MSDEQEERAERDEDVAEESKRAYPNYITPAGLKKMTDELAWRGQVERPRVTQEVSDAAAQGDRSENAEYIYGKKKLREIDRRMRFLRKRIEIAVPVDPAVDRGDKVYFGATVVIEDEDGVTNEYQLVGEDEVDTTSRKLSWRSPIGKALLGKSLDDEVRVHTPGGLRVVTIVGVKYV